ncbi:MAG: hypothetical protein WCP28_22120, partial [Actinomycetes bacterium]
VQDWLAQDPAHAGDLVRALERHGRKRAPFSIHGPLTITTGDTAAGIVTVVAGADGTVDGV